MIEVHLTDSTPAVLSIAVRMRQQVCDAALSVSKDPDDREAVLTYRFISQEYENLVSLHGLDEGIFSTP